MNTPNLLHAVKEVRHVYEPDVNKLLADGWILLAVASGHEPGDENEVTPFFRYSVGRIEHSNK
jgi:hypothetical protein